VSRTTGRVVQGIPTACALCPAGCGILAFVDDRGTLEGLAGNPLHPYNRGAICSLGSSAVNLLRSWCRVPAPLRRVGDRGDGKWEAVSWNEAGAAVREALSRARSGAPGERLAVSAPERKMSPFLDRWVSFFPNGILEASDGYEREAERSVYPGFPDGAWSGTADLENAEVVLSFGANPLGSVRRFLGAAGAWAQGVRSGARWFTIDPRLSETANAGRCWVPIRPGTDGALAAALAQEILATGREDPLFSDRLGPGEAERIRVSLADWTPERAARICGVPAGTIREMAGTFAGAKRAVAIYGSGVLARKNGEQDARQVLLLNLLTGNLDREGGIRFAARLIRQPTDLRILRTPAPVLAGTLFRDLQRGSFAVGTLITCDANPAITDPDCSRTAEVLRNREQIPFHVALASVWNETARMADLVLPAAGYLEEWGLCEGVVASSGEAWVGLRQPVLRSREEARAAEELFLEMVRELGDEGRKAFPFPSVEGFYREVLAASVVSVGYGPWPGALQKRGFLLSPTSGAGMGDGRVAGAEGTIGESPTNRNRYAGGVRRGRFSAPETFGTPHQDSGSGTGLSPDPEVRDPAGCEKTLLLFGTALAGSDSPRGTWVAEIDHQRPVWMHPSAAREIGCRQGDWVRVRGPAGEIRTRVRLTEGLHPEAVAMQGTAAGMEEACCGPGLSPEGGDAGENRVWWKRETYGENVRKLIPWPSPDPGPVSPGWEDTRVRIRRCSG
jgi:thiosulfate reductase / polysulfide reductase chain A